MSAAFIRNFKPALMACAAGATLAAAPALGQSDEGVDPRALLDQFVAEKLISQEQAERMLRNARAASPQPQVRAPLPPGGVDADGAQVIPYVPDVVREQIVEQVRTELAGQAQAEGWAKPGETPEWTRRISLYGDVRVRAEGRFYNEENYPDFPNWGAINDGGGFQVNPDTPGYVNPPYLNVNEDRRRFRLRARLGVRAEVADWIRADVRLATGADNGPVSTNQTLGGDGTGKYHIWLDRASLRLTPASGFQVDLGRFANPFWTSDLVFDNDMNFDGLAISGRGAVSEQFGLFGSAGAFPVFNTGMNFGSRDAGPFKSTDKYLFAAQAGLDFRPAENIRARLAVGYFHFDGVQGRFSSPGRWDQDVFDTDYTRPAFQQFGNTMVALRQITADPSVPDGSSPEVQYFGLGSKFEMLNLRGQLEYDVSERIGIRLEGDYVKNLGFDRAAITPLALNNFSPRTTIGAITTGGEYEGGDSGWQLRLAVGSLAMGHGQGDWSAEPGDWSFHLAYRHLASDAVIDGFADSDFGLGGTNAKGWLAGASYGVARNALFGLRWASSDEVAGPPLSVDRLFLDFNTKF
ncbi:putative porin [Sandaracinobacter sp. RS1-74]|uniref:putative porin n=1 Tax=Sandaracinobacteroides sayramensis TaxID=2913411 RepID=UPI001EDA8C91|nr:putative porin [Sandaracinobacteroides sayramensis]MCG2842565.1 putative porin [Sandaracinobacteroides sayramensis]